MDIVLISACQKNAIRRTRAVLDRYAFRMGDSTWSTPITQEGLHSLQIHLRATASRNTAVICLRNDRKRGLIPLWIVGSRARFGDDWRTPVFVTEGKTRERTMDHSDASWWGEVKRIAAMSGLFHDLGKNNQFFARKILMDGAIADPIRHEWISTRIVESLWNEQGSTLESVWDSAMRQAHEKRLNGNHPLLACNDAFSAVLFCVATHHRMLNEEKNCGVPDADNMIRAGKMYSSGVEDKKNKSMPDISLIRNREAGFPDEITSKVARMMGKLREHPNGMDPLYWRAVAFMARAALILADHQVSSQRCDQGECQNMVNNPPFANTVKDAKGKRRHNQTLQWHLQSVGQQAAAMADRMFHLEDALEGLSPDSLSGIDVPATGRFQWQELAAQSVTKIRSAHPGKPMLLAVISGTGSGKTRACARLAIRAVLNNKARFTALFNLRTLTLQTGSAYRHQMGIQESDMAVVIGDAMTHKAYRAQEQPENEDEMDRSLGEDIAITGMGNPLPDWLAHFVKDDHNLKDLIAAPVFVSTADYLVPAGDPGAQGRHIVPLLRLMNSDLILDEIDNYDAKSVVAILRLVQLAGLFGRNVIASSATMTPALADALGRFYAHGAAMRAALNGSDSPDFACGVISDLSEPSMDVMGSSEVFSAVFRLHLERLQTALAQKTEISRKGCLLKMEKSEEAFRKTIAQGVLGFHEKHKWLDIRSGKSMSVGLIRVANIRTAIIMADYLRDELSRHQPRVACYHSRLFRGHRIMLERDLDQILSRGENPDAPSGHLSVRKHMDRDDVQSGLFIVVATPVEEVGRDHDFDWAIIEPSSAQSIVQTSGRVHRHRAGHVAHSNVGILQYNLRACHGKDVAFLWPGNETRDNSTEFVNHDMTQLVDWSLLSHALDARLRFDTDNHLLARADENSLTDAMKDPLRRITGSDALWMSGFTYKNWPLREQKFTDEWRYDPEDNCWFIYQETKNGWCWMQQSSDRMQNRWAHDDRRWLCPTHLEIVQFCEENGLEPDWAFTVSVPNYDGNASLRQLKSSYDGTDFIPRTPVILEGHHLA
ncbi:type I-F CRISPR-associated helicase Cas3f [Acidithiobacillus sp.]|uniref:type I-F CRISPR-associated helicase Cas3f n=1 Tax=Acidithiobacillus sp. TaxID=1872118 RepID=UPI0025B8BC98|nr:type I-F CRISPR-associated helicase Cas3f [Acidithiobacillus sp.]MCK9189003.1 type I-F CRISPR-associated helicase Cas3f [Acidithiobacillus sp.]MCK9359336.1 type I-F CRISPR-associated helicase Cas3f [Acidithiobacillus sp.]